MANQFAFGPGALEWKQFSGCPGPNSGVSDQAATYTTTSEVTEDVSVGGNVGRLPLKLKAIPP